MLILIRVLLGVYLAAMNLYAFFQIKLQRDSFECGECEGRCPYNLPIREMLKAVAKDFGE